MKQVPTKETVYSSRVDWLAAAALSILLLLIMGLGGQLIRAGEIAGWVPLGIGLLLIAVIAMLGIPTRYTLTDQHLQIQGGVLWREKIEYRKIEKLEALFSFQAYGPAWSFRKVKIEFLANGYRDVRYISPLRREEFIAELTRRKDLVSES